jgi:hypothetical protein
VVGSLVVFSVTYLIIASRQLRFLGLDRPAGATVGAVSGASRWRRRSTRSICTS